jgi:hypothetical protein
MMCLPLPFLVRIWLDALKRRGLKSAAEAQKRGSFQEPLFTHAPESHGCESVDEWLSVQGSAPRQSGTLKKRSHGCEAVELHKRKTLK